MLEMILGPKTWAWWEGYAEFGPDVLAVYQKRRAEFRDWWHHGSVKKSGAASKATSVASEEKTGSTSRDRVIMEATWIFECQQQAEGMRSRAVAIYANDGQAMAEHLEEDILKFRTRMKKLSEDMRSNKVEAYSLCARLSAMLEDEKTASEAKPTKGIDATIKLIYNLSFPWVFDALLGKLHAFAAGSESASEARKNELAAAKSEVFETFEQIRAEFGEFNLFKEKYIEAEKIAGPAVPKSRVSTTRPRGKAVGR